MEGVEAVDGDTEFVSSRELCTQLYTEAVERGIRVNGKLCNAALLGFGSDLTVSGSTGVEGRRQRWLQDRSLECCFLCHRR